MAKGERVFSEDLIGCKIVGYVPHGYCEILLLEDGRTIEISNEHLGSVGQRDSNYGVMVGAWKPTEVTADMSAFRISESKAS